MRSETHTFLNAMLKIAQVALRNPRNLGSDDYQETEFAGSSVLLPKELKTCLRARVVTPARQKCLAFSLVVRDEDVIVQLGITE